ncbi:hypothetical protein CLOSTMETH_03316 [[Clostridium] methylpentosum DSM 5476]|uniref:Uncharacterized protein n=1 Tax=[Clostridium] methylpentosum DSM 5476 TaxID=537013 RepID=C0EHB7_9FIRM|nr:hypothetical protein CLOSTMETH_03316 [[Clostridium] methylpentosum DSM 5476]
MSIKPPHFLNIFSTATHFSPLCLILYRIWLQIAIHKGKLRLCS